MISRQDLEAFQARHTTLRDKALAQVNLYQGAIDSAKALLLLYDNNEKMAAEMVDPGPPEANDPTTASGDCV